jgi:hypothetical protein
MVPQNLFGTDQTLDLVGDSYQNVEWVRVNRETIPSAPHVQAKENP